MKIFYKKEELCHVCVYMYKYIHTGVPNKILQAVFSETNENIDLNFFT